MKYIVGLFGLALLAMPIFVVLRSFAVDDGGTLEVSCTGFVSGMLAHTWVMLLSRK